MQAWRADPVPKIPPTSDPEFPDRVRIWDSVRRALVPVGPRQGEAGLYVCGITPYDATHLGHAFTYLTFDLLYRAWLDLGLAVHYTQNITDIDDPLLARATRDGVDWVSLAAEQNDYNFKVVPVTVG